MDILAYPPVCISTHMSWTLRSRRCILKANNARFWVLRAACQRCCAHLGQGRGGRERHSRRSSCRPRRGGGRRLASSGQEWLHVCSDLVFLVIFLVVHAGPGRLVLHTLKTLIQRFERQLSRMQRKKIKKAICYCSRSQMNINNNSRMLTRSHVHY